MMIGASSRVNRGPQKTPKNLSHDLLMCLCLLTKRSIKFYFLKFDHQKKRFLPFKSSKKYRFKQNILQPLHIMVL